MPCEDSGLTVSLKPEEQKNGVTSKHFNILKSSELRLERKLEISGSSD
jgi:hypothetical protein